MFFKGLFGGEVWFLWYKEDFIYVGVCCIEMFIELIGMVSLYR